MNRHQKRILSKLEKLSEEEQIFEDLIAIVNNGGERKPSDLSDIPSPGISIDEICEIFKDTSDKNLIIKVLNSLPLINITSKQSKDLYSVKVDEDFYILKYKEEYYLVYPSGFDYPRYVMSLEGYTR